MLQTGGPAAVLNEIDQIQADHVRTVYFVRLINGSPLNDNAIQRSIDAAAAMTSDHDKLEVLLALATAQRLHGTLPQPLSQRRRSARSQSRPSSRAQRDRPSLEETSDAHTYPLVDYWQRCRPCGDRHAQTPRTSALPPPTTKAAVGAFDAKIVERAAQLIASEAQWNRSDKSECPAGAKTFGIACALNKAIEEAAGVGESQNPPPAGDVGLPTPSDCRFHASGSDQEGTCGMLFDEVPVITIAKVPAITTGVWRKDAQPTEVWAGKMSDAESPVQYEADQLVTAITTKKGSDRLVNYNNDPATTFADVQAFFKTLGDRVIKNGAADLDDSTDDVEIEI